MRLSHTLGAPGIYNVAPTPTRRFQTVPLDTCAFVGLAPRGPARVPKLTDVGERLELPTFVPYPTHRCVPRLVHSWDEYRWLYGDDDGSTRLPGAVAAYFRQGGRRAWVMRIVHDYGASETEDTALRGCALHELSDLRTAGGPVRLLSRNEGAWGNALQVTLACVARPIGVEVDNRPTSIGELKLLRAGVRSAEVVVSGDLLRVTTDAESFLSVVDSVRADGAQIVVGLESNRRRAEAVVRRVERLEGIARVRDEDPLMDRTEEFRNLGFHPAHPRQLLRTLDDESELVRCFRSDRDARVDVLDTLVGRTCGSHLVTGSGGRDRNADVRLDDLCDPAWIFTGDFPDDGVFALAHIEERTIRPRASKALADAHRAARVAMLCVPDLFPAERAQPAAIAPAGRAATFADCVASVSAPSAPVAVALTDNVGDAVHAQAVLTKFAEAHRQFVVLLDAPPDASTPQVLRWRERFESSYAAGYHPWVDVARQLPGRVLQRTRCPASAYAAGVIAARELRLGVPWGPANEYLVGAVGCAQRLTPSEHDELHLRGLNVVVAEPAGMLLTAARTMALDASYRQLSVRRLMTMLQLTFEEQSQWIVFEPNDDGLLRWLGYSVRAYLEELFNAGALAGASTDEAFFVNTGADLNTRARRDRGELLVEVGVAPVEPIEYLVLSIAADEGGLLKVEERRG